MAFVFWFYKGVNGVLLFGPEVGGTCRVSMRERPSGRGKGLWWFKEEGILINTLKYSPSTHSIHSKVGVTRKTG